MAGMLLMIVSKSKGKLKIENAILACFSGKISLENYGGFSSIRYYRKNLMLKNKYVTVILLL